MSIEIQKKIQDIIGIVLKWLFPLTAIFSFFQFFQPFLPDASFYEFEGTVLVITVILAVLWIQVIEYRILEKYLYRYISKDSKLILNIYYDDIFDMKFNEFIRVIPMDQDLDCDRRNIREKSVQYQFRQKECVAYERLERLKAKNERIIAIDNFFLLRVSEYVSGDNIELDTYNDYFSMIYELCKFIDTNSHGKSVVCSVIGGNIQFKEGNLNSMQRLQLLKLVIESYSFQHEVKIHIVVKKDQERKGKYDLTTL